MAIAGLFAASRDSSGQLPSHGGFCNPQETLDSGCCLVYLREVSGPHSKIIAAEAKAHLVPLGFRRQGRSRLWIKDHGSWLNIVEFAPSQWPAFVQLNNAAHWLWTGRGFLSFNFSLPRGPHSEFENERQFQAAMTEIARAAASRAQAVEERFHSFEAIATHVIDQTAKSARMGPSWFGFHAGIAAGLIGEFEQAERFFRAITDERVKPHSNLLLAFLCSPVEFRATINERVAAQRVALRLAERGQTLF